VRNIAGNPQAVQSYPVSKSLQHVPDCSQPSRKHSPGHSQLAKHRQPHNQQGSHDHAINDCHLHSDFNVTLLPIILSGKFPLRFQKICSTGPTYPLCFFIHLLPDGLFLFTDGICQLLLPAFYLLFPGAEYLLFPG